MARVFLPITVPGTARPHQSQIAFGTQLKTTCIRDRRK